MDSTNQPLSELITKDPVKLAEALFAFASKSESIRIRAGWTRPYEVRMAEAAIKLIENACGLNSAILPKMLSELAEWREKENPNEADELHRRAIKIRRLYPQSNFEPSMSFLCCSYCVLLSNKMRFSEVEHFARLGLEWSKSENQVSAGNVNELYGYLDGALERQGKVIAEVS